MVKLFKSLLLACNHVLFKLYVRNSIPGLGLLRFYFSLFVEKVVDCPPKPILVKLSDSIKLWINPLYDKGVEAPLFYNGLYEAGTLDIIRKCVRRGDICIDVGANIGYFTLFLSKYVGELGSVLSFEPSRTTYNILSQNLIENSCRNVLLFNYGLGDIVEERKLYDILSNRGASTLIGDNSNSDFQLVKVDILDNVLNKNNLYLVNFIKIDVEGFELPVLKGASNLLSSNSSPIIMVEFTKDKNDDIIDLLLENDYLIFRQKYGKERYSKLISIGDHSSLKRQENLFCFKKYHLEILHGDIFD